MPGAERALLGLFGAERAGSTGLWPKRQAQDPHGAGLGENGGSAGWVRGSASPRGTRPHAGWDQGADGDTAAKRGQERAGPARSQVGGELRGQGAARGQGMWGTDVVSSGPRQTLQMASLPGAGAEGRPGRGMLLWVFCRCG